ncbi:hypothetical protein RF11_08566 [Thelohanellus kitauei]|uniref:ISXO2-like transposase domain-containing protein n=1 Tax=Thelohanellus kitauei TaxID=669202 RepID=A0A0C2MBE9_THEKT|nr:hypothetical protein RF11_08566 [Thelohanellus kitauei]
MPNYAFIIKQKHPWIGKGEGVTVEIDESKFGRKCHRERRVKGVWLFGVIQRKTPEVLSRALQIPVQNHAHETFSIIQRCIKPGPTVISNGRTSYMGFDQMGYLHLIVNHSQTFFDPTKEAHTNIPHAFNGNKKMAT